MFNKKERVSRLKKLDKDLEIKEIEHLVKIEQEKGKIELERKEAELQTKFNKVAELKWEGLCQPRWRTELMFMPGILTNITD